MRVIELAAIRREVPQEWKHFLQLSLLKFNSVPPSVAQGLLLRQADLKNSVCSADSMVRQTWSYKCRTSATAPSSFLQQGALIPRVAYVLGDVSTSIVSSCSCVCVCVESGVMGPPAVQQGKQSLNTIHCTLLAWKLTAYWTAVLHRKTWVEPFEDKALK